jgi:membrane-bound serine protease (ClpP class)
MACSLFLWIWLQRYLPHLPYFHRLILTSTSGKFSGQVSAIWPAVGSVGRAMTDLRPGGSAQFPDPAIGDVRIADVISECGFVSAGADVVVREVQGNRVIVRTASNS